MLWPLIVTTVICHRERLPLRLFLGSILESNNSRSSFSFSPVDERVAETFVNFTVFTGKLTREFDETSEGDMSFERNINHSDTKPEKSGSGSRTVNALLRSLSTVDVVQMLTEVTKCVCLPSELEGEGMNVDILFLILSKGNEEDEEEKKKREI